MEIILVSKTFRVVIFLVVSVASFATCIHTNNNEPIIINNSGEQFAGSAKCENCHREIYQSFLETAHFHTSQSSSREKIMGSFENGENVFSYSYYSKVAMEERNSGVYQVEYDKNFKERQRYKFDIIIGSGTRGQSYLSWKKNRLIQLPVSFFTASDVWANSPGFPDNQPLFTRTISDRCLECHSTYFKTLSPANAQSPEFDRRQIMFGVQCESCHGPASSHVIYHEQHQGEKTGKFIDDPFLFTRQQKIDLCGFCHGGSRQSEKPAFSFSPGDTLSHYVKQDTAVISSQEVEVHDNQYGLLTRSKCFKMSTTLSCNTCHNTHNQERGDVVLYSSRCMSCHDGRKVNFCKMAAISKDQIKRNCIDCHMPQKKSKMLEVNLEGKSTKTPSVLRSHFIAIYREESTKYLLLHNGR